MHSTLVTAAALLMATLELLGFGFPLGLLAAAVVVSVVFVGIPHGAADHLTGRRLLQPFVGTSWGPLFFAAYLSISALTLIGWYSLPTATVLGFFFIAAWHFGIEERDDDSKQLLFTPRAIACGGLVIWIPCTMQGASVESTLTLISDSISTEQSGLIVDSVAACSPLFGLLVILDCCFELQAWRQKGRLGLRQLISSRSLRYASLSLLFCVANPMLSFGIYFCGWHSIRGLCELREQLGCSFVSLARRLAPLTIATLGLVAVGFIAWSRGLTVSEATIRWLFLGLSAIAVPHLLLDALSSYQSSRASLVPISAAGASS